MLNIYIPARAEDSDITAIVETTLGVTTSALDVTLNLVANTHEFDNKDLNVYVTTNSPAGYKLSMTATNTSLVETHDNTKTIQTLPVLAGGYTESTFVVNKWGYKVGSGNWMALEPNVVIKNTNTMANNDTTTVNFASKINYTQSPGEYSTELTFAVVANPVYATLQNLREGLCTTTLSYAMDTRDSQVYPIQKLKDGRCWMLQNMNLVSTSVDLNSDNTNITGTLAASTYNNWRKDRNTNNDTSYYTPIFIPTTATSDTQYHGIDPNTGLPFGTLYNYCAATAGTRCQAKNTASSDATEDICPAGWKMPTGGSGGEWQQLYNKYSSAAALRAPASSNGASIALSGRASTSVAESLNLVGYYWSSTYDNAMTVKTMCVHKNGSVNITGYDYRHYPSSVRCVRKY